MPSQNEQQEVKRFFDGYAKDFNSIYLEHEKSLFNRFIDRWLRASMFSRSAEAYNFIREINAKTLLDVGCGPGHHGIMFSKGLGIKVTGVDISTNMINTANDNAIRNQADDLCKFHTEDFMQYTPEENFDVILSLGVLEYISDPIPFIKRMLLFSTHSVLFSLPVKWHWLMPQRSYRYKLRKCPLYFYSENEIKNLLEHVGPINYKIHRMGRDYLVILSKRE